MIDDYSNKSMSEYQKKTKRRNMMSEEKKMKKEKRYQVTVNTPSKIKFGDGRPDILINNGDVLTEKQITEADAAVLMKKGKIKEV